MNRVLLGIALLAGAAHAEVIYEAVLGPRAANMAARGLGRLVAADDGSLAWEIRVADMTGFATSTTLRDGPDGPVVGTFTNPPATGSHVGTFPVVAPEVAQALSKGTAYVRLDTAAYPHGEIGGAFAPAVIAGRTCGCATADEPTTFRRCVRRAVADLPRELRRSASMRTLLRVARVAKCGASNLPGGATCRILPPPDRNLVVEPLCARLRPARCAALGGVDAGDGCP